MDGSRRGGDGGPDLEGGLAVGAAEARAVVDAAVGGELLDGVDRPPARVALLRRAAPRRRRHPGFPPPPPPPPPPRRPGCFSPRAREVVRVWEEGGGEEEEAMMISEGESSGSTAQLVSRGGKRWRITGNGSAEETEGVGAACAQKGGKGKCYGHSNENK